MRFSKALHLRDDQQFYLVPPLPRAGSVAREMYECVEHLCARVGVSGKVPAGLAVYTARTPLLRVCRCPTALARGNQGKLNWSSSAGCLASIRCQESGGKSSYLSPRRSLASAVAGALRPLPCSSKRDPLACNPPATKRPLGSRPHPWGP